MTKIEYEPFYIKGISVRTTNKNNQMAADIPALWHRFMSEAIASQITNKISSDIYAVYTDYESDHTKPYTILLGCRVPADTQSSNDLLVMSFDGGRYQKYIAKGDLKDGVVYQAWKSIWESDINRAYTADFEVYGPKALDMANAEVDIFIATKK